MSSERIYRKSYSSFSGIDTSSPPSLIEGHRLADCENMYIDYEAGHGLSLETAPGFRKIFDFGKKIYGIFSYRAFGGEESEDYLVVHADDCLYRFPVSQRDSLENLSPIMSGMAKKHSCAFTVGNSLYILDSESYYRVDGSGVCKRLSAEDAYVPTTMYRSQKCEDKNILTDRFKNTFLLTDAQEILANGDDLTYEIISEELAICAVSGLKNKNQPCVIIPPSVTIRQKSYKVIRIADSAFNGTDVVFVSIPETVTLIGTTAFLACKRLRCVILPESLETIGTSAFHSCSSLHEIYLKSGLKLIEYSAFHLVPSDFTVYYEGDEAAFSQVEIRGRESYFPYTPIYSARQSEYKILVHSAFSGCSQIDGVLVDKESVPFDDTRQDIAYTAERSLFGEIENVYMIVKDRVSLKNREVEVIGRFTPQSDSITDKDGFFSVHSETVGAPFEAISKCTSAEVHGETVFLTGNPSLPNTVFYSTKDMRGSVNPLYFGVYSFIEDGIGNTPNAAMISADDTLIVLKSEANHGSSIYYHTKSGTGGDGYSEGYSSGSIGRVRAVSNFLDDPVILTDKGLFGVDIDNVNLERSVCHRSSNVDAMLQKTGTENARLAEWRGYLCVLVNGEIYLADSRKTFTHKNGDREYEWFRLTDIGVYDGQTPVYHTLTEPRTDKYSYVVWEGYYHKLGYTEKERPVGPNDLLVSTHARPSPPYDRTYPFIITTDENGEKTAIVCDTDGEMAGGEFSPACELCCVGELLFFGCENGAICCFNNDKRNDGSDETCEAGEIPRKYYTHNGRRYVSGFATASDVCGLGGYTKSTVAGSCAIRMKASSAGVASVSVCTDRCGTHELGEVNASVFNLSDTDFSVFSFATHEGVAVRLPEREKRWNEKQYKIYSNEFMRPFGVYEISYDYTVAGRIKK